MYLHPWSLRFGRLRNRDNPVCPVGAASVDRCIDFPRAPAADEDRALFPGSQGTGILDVIGEDGGPEARRQLDRLDGQVPG